MTSDASEISVQVRFTIHDDETGIDFTDALYYPLSMWPVDEAILEQDKQDRFTSWKEIISSVGE